jgi:hypothetical protein
MSESFYKRMFLLGAVWNLLGGVLVLVLTDWIFASARLTPPYPPPYYQSWIALFMTFGIGYYMAFRDPYANKNIVILGMIGKLAFAAIFIGNMIFSPGQIPMVFLIAVIGDVIFAFLFGMFLNFAKKTKP